MGLMQLFRYPSQNAILKTVSEGLKSGKKDPGRKHTDSYLLFASQLANGLGKQANKPTDILLHFLKVSNDSKCILVSHISLISPAECNSLQYPQDDSQLSTCAKSMTGADPVRRVTLSFVIESPLISTVKLYIMKT